MARGMVGNAASYIQGLEALSSEILQLGSQPHRSYCDTTHRPHLMASVNEPPLAHDNPLTSTKSM